MRTPSPGVSSCWTAAAGALTAAMVPGSSPAAARIASARAALRATSSSRSRAPAAAERDQFAVAVAAGQVGVNAEGAEQLVHGESGHAEGRLGHAGVGDGAALALGFGAAEGGRGEHDRRQVAERLEVVAEAGEGDEQVGQHAGGLAALAGEEEGDLARLLARRHEDTGGRVERAGVAELGGQIVEVGGDQRHLDRAAGAGHGPGQVAEAPRVPGAVVGRQELGEVVHLLGRPGLIGAAEDEQLGRPLFEPVLGLGAAVVGAEHRVEVGATEAEGADARESLGGRRVPGPGFGVEEEGALVAVPVAVGLVELAGGGADAAVQRPGDLDDPGQAGGALGVADLGLDRAQGAGAGGGARLGEHLGQCGQLGAVAHDGPGAVGLDQPDLGGRDAGHAVGALQRSSLPLGAGGGEAQAAAVARARDGLDHGVHPVAVALGVGQALEHHAGHAFAQGDAVGLGVEGAAVAARRQGVDRCEEEEVLQAVVHVGPAAQNHVAGLGAQLLAGHVEGREGGGAGGIDGVVGPAQVQAVGDAPGDHIGEHPGKGVLVERREVGVEFGGEGPEVGLVQRPEAVGPGQVGTRFGAEDDRGALPVELAGAVAGVGEGAGRHFQGQELGRVDGRERRGRDAVGEGVEGHVGEEPAPLGGSPVTGALGDGGGVVVDAGIPAFGRDLGDGVDAGDDVGPVAVGVARLGEDARHADDRDLERIGLLGGVGVGVGGGGAGGGGGCGCEELGRAVAHLAVEFGNGRRGRAEGCDLADHDHALAPLVVLADLDQSPCAVRRRA